jgi:hypothetical protein
MENFFGGHANGFNAFTPTVSTNRFVPPVYITEFQLSNKKKWTACAFGGSPLQNDIRLLKFACGTISQRFHFRSLP